MTEPRPLPGAQLLRRRRRFALLLIAPAALLVLAVALVPATWSLVLSLQSRDLSGGTAAVHWVGLANYRDWLSDPVFHHAVMRSVVWTVCSVGLQLVLGLGVALLLQRAFPGRGLVRALVLIPWVLPIVSTANIWVWMFNDVYGILNTALLALGVIRTPIPWLSASEFALPSAILVKTWREFPFSALMLMAALQAIPAELYEAARLDGARAWRRFIHVTLPGIRLVVLVILMLQTIWTFNDVTTLYLLTRGGPGDATTTLPILVYNTAFGAGALSRGASGAVMMFIVVLVLIATFFVLYNRAESRLRA
jgi:multiple sugar transport system permease protein